MKIGELADLAVVTTKTIRYYESIGLLPEPARTPAGYRDYDESFLQRLEVVRSARELGMSLEEVKETLRLGKLGETPCG